MCDKFELSPNINPLTGKTIKEGATLHKQINSFCQKKEKNCKQININPEINPLTKKPLNLKVLKLFKNLCNESSEERSEKSSSSDDENTPIAQIIRKKKKKIIVDEDTPIAEIIKKKKIDRVTESLFEKTEIETDIKTDIKTDDLCDNFKKNPELNPVTKNTMTKNGNLYKSIKAFCVKKKTHCKKLLKDQLINPVTNKKLSEKNLELFQNLCDNKIKKTTRTVTSKGYDIEDGYQTDTESIIMEQEPETFHNFTDNPLACTIYKNVKLRDHQLKVCHYIKYHPDVKGMLLYHSLGSGKTISAITIVRCLLHLNKTYKVFMLTPTSLVSNFSKEMDKLKIKFGKNVRIMSHGKFINKIINEGNEFCKGSIIIIDEAQDFKTVITSKNGLRAKTMFRATSVAEKVFLLSATPIQNRPEEFANLYAMIAKKEDQIKELYKFFSYTPNLDEKNLKIKKGNKKWQNQLVRMLYHKVSYFKNEDTENYPTVSYYDKNFYMSKEYYKAYSKIEEGQADLYKIYMNTSNLKIFYNGIRRAVNYIDEEIPTEKIEWAIDFVRESIENKKKTLLYSNWIHSGLKIVQNELDKLNIKWKQVNGSMTINQRNDSVKQFNSGKVKVLFISSAGSLGLDLKGTNSVIIIEPAWNLEKIKQVVGRAVRFESHKGLPKELQHVDVYNLYLYKPKNNKDKLKSADEYLKKLSSTKDTLINIFYKTLIAASI